MHKVPHNQGWQLEIDPNDPRDGGSELTPARDPLTSKPELNHACMSVCARVLKHNLKEF